MAKVLAVYKVICPLEDPFGEGTRIANRRVELKKCEKCKNYLGVSYTLLEIFCRTEEKDGN